MSSRILSSSFSTFLSRLHKKYILGIYKSCFISKNAPSLLTSRLNGFLYWWFITFGSVNDGTLGRYNSFASLATTITVQFQQFGKIETGLLQNLHLTNVDIVQWVDTLATSLNIIGNGVQGQFADQLLQVGSADFIGNDFSHALTNLAHLRLLGIAGFALRLLILGSETDAEDAPQIAIGGLSLNNAFNQGLPFLDHGPVLVCGQIHAMEIAQDVAFLNILGNQTELAE